jgi:CrcB protein
MNGTMLVFVGGGLGAAARHGINSISGLLFGSRYPWGTFLINVLGSMLIGILAEWFALQSQASANLRLFLVTGILGGFTTFSAFSLEIGLLHERGATVAAIGYAALSVGCAVGAMFGGMYAVRHWAV